MAHEVIFEAKHMHKAFGPTIALKDVDIQICRGEIRGLIGENGSGKSTIMSIAAGMQPATSGEMFYKGQPWHPKSMVDSQHQGISMILQEANTIPHVTVAQNLFAGQENEFSKCGLINMNRMYKRADEMLAKFGITTIKGRDPIDKLTFEDRKLIEIVRCVTDDTEILVVDETTTALSHEGREILYRLIHKMTEEGNKAVVFVSHDMDEILEQCTDLTVLRDGEIKGHLTKDEMNAPDAVKKNLSLIPFFGRWDDLLTLLNTPCEAAAVSLLQTQLEADIDALNYGRPVSLLAKWLPGVNASNKKTVSQAKKLARAFGFTPAQYRKTLSALRASIRILENDLRVKDYSFDYEKQPSRAMYKYRGAFRRNDGVRYAAFLRSVTKGEAVLHADNVTPYELVSPFLNWANFTAANPSYLRPLSAEEAASLNATWAAMPDFGGDENALAVVDTSGSMYGRPMATSVGLAAYFAERNTGPYHNMFMSFSANGRVPLRAASSLSSIA